MCALPAPAMTCRGRRLRRPLAFPPQGGRWPEGPDEGEEVRRITPVGTLISLASLDSFPLEGGSHEGAHAARPLPPPCAHWGTSPKGGGFGAARPSPPCQRGLSPPIGGDWGFLQTRDEKPSVAAYAAPPPFSREVFVRPPGRAGRGPIETSAPTDRDGPSAWGATTSRAGRPEFPKTHRKIPATP